MEYTCPSCGNIFSGKAELDAIGWHTVCPECHSSFDVQQQDSYDLCLYEFIVAVDGIDYQVFFVNGISPHNALITYCKFTGEIKGARMEALKRLDFYNALELANEWLCDRILHMHTVEEFFYKDKSFERMEIPFSL